MPYNAIILVKEARPFIGIVLTLNDYDYYAPLTSPKPKHLHMKNQVDFLKINGGVWGAINFNNMIPIHSDQLEHIDIRILPTDDKATVDYKNLLANQLSWCNTSANAASIIQKAEKLYRIITSKTARPQLAKRCCDFRVLGNGSLHRLPTYAGRSRTEERHGQAEPCNAHTGAACRP